LFSSVDMPVLLSLTNVITVAIVRCYAYPPNE
jgi:hypothetical protein